MSGISALLTLFEGQRPRLRAVAFRILGSRSDAEDAVQETWLRLNRSADKTVDSLEAWLTTVISHICLDMLRARRTRGDDVARPHQEEQHEPPVTSAVNSPEEELVLADSVSAALLVVLQKLAPAERVAFVLHDMFDLSFDEIAPILDRTPEAARQLASRARRRVRGEDSITEAQQNERHRQREIVNVFLAAAKGGDLQGLLAVLDPDVVMRSDAAAGKLGGPTVLEGATAVADMFKGRAQAAKPALIDDVIGIVVAPQGKIFVILQITFRDDKIIAIEAVANKTTLAEAEIVLLQS